MKKIFVMYESGAEGYTVISENAYYTAKAYARSEKEVFRYHDYHFEIIDDSREDEIECEDFEFMPETPSEDFGDGKEVTKERNWLIALYDTKGKAHSAILYNFTETEIVQYARETASGPYLLDIESGSLFYVYHDKGFRLICTYDNFEVEGKIERKRRDEYENIFFK